MGGGATRISPIDLEHGVFILNETVTKLKRRICISIAGYKDGNYTHVAWMCDVWKLRK